MDSDFHYYGTGTAALGAGFGVEEAAMIANAAQYVDWFDSDYWSYWRMVDENGAPVMTRGSNVPHRYSAPQLSIQKIDWKMSGDYDSHIWNAFHFPPGNLTYRQEEDSWRGDFSALHRVRDTSLRDGDVNKLCRPFSKFALDLIDDTLLRFEELSIAEGTDLDALVARLVHPRVRCPIDDGRKMALIFLGMRMHVLADTWAHQDFSGEQNEAINSAGIQNEVRAKDARGNWRRTLWTGTIWALHDDTDCAGAPSPLSAGDMVCAGHGQMGHYPDYSWLTFSYPAGWLPDDLDFHERDNPKEYKEAWSWLSFAMSLCNGSKTDHDRPQGTPREIEEVINTWHELSPDTLQAIPESEELWKKTSIGQQIPDRWDPQERESLGLYDGLAATRFGSINVRKESILHYMETAASMHYQFCVDWIAAHPEYTWTPRAPVT